MSEILHTWAQEFWEQPAKFYYYPNPKVDRRGYIIRWLLRSGQVLCEVQDHLPLHVGVLEETKEV